MNTIKTEFPDATHFNSPVIARPSRHREAMRDWARSWKAWLPRMRISDSDADSARCYRLAAFALNRAVAFRTLDRVANPRLTTRAQQR